MNKFKKSLESFLLELFFSYEIDEELNAYKHLKCMEMSDEEFESEMIADILREVKASIILIILIGIGSLLFTVYLCNFFCVSIMCRKIMIIAYLIFMFIIFICFALIIREERIFLLKVKCLRKEYLRKGKKSMKQNFILRLLFLLALQFIIYFVSQPIFDIVLLSENVAISDSSKLPSENISNMDTCIYDEVKPMMNCKYSDFSIMVLCFTILTDIGFLLLVFFEVFNTLDKYIYIVSRNAIGKKISHSMFIVETEFISKYITYNNLYNFSMINREIKITSINAGNNKIFSFLFIEENK